MKILEFIQKKRNERKLKKISKRLFKSEKILSLIDRYEKKSRNLDRSFYNPSWLSVMFSKAELDGIERSMREIKRTASGREFSSIRKSLLKIARRYFDRLESFYKANEKNYTVKVTVLD